jgi:hypothetical protein
MYVRRSAVSTQAENRAAPASVHATLSSAGRALDGDVRGDMERRFGCDFSGVRVHTDSAAAASACAVNASAYTVGNHIVFGEGRYLPRSPEGRRMLAHELTHTLRQRGSAAPTGAVSLGSPHDPSEREVEQSADAALRSERPRISSAQRL